MSEADLGSAPADAAPVVAPVANVDISVAKTPNSAVDRAMARFEKGETVDDGFTPAPKKDAETSTDKPAKAAKAEDSTATPSSDRNPDGTFKAKTADTQTPAKAPATTEQPTTQPKPQTPASDAPARFASDPEAKAAWAQLPEPVKAATSRVIREVEQGIEKYRADATTYTETFKPFVEMAQRSKIDPAQQLAQYVNIDMMLAKDFDAGISQIFKNSGKDVRAWAAQITGQPAPAVVPQDQIIAALKDELAQIKQNLGGVTQTIEQQRSAGITQSLEGFVAKLPDADRALFTELDAEIAAHLRDPGTTLEQAFQRAKQEDADRYTRRYGGAVQPAPAEAQTLEPDRTAQTRKAELSIHGAPGTGSDPVTRRTPNSQPRKSPDDAIDRAMRNMGLA